MRGFFILGSWGTKKLIRLRRTMVLHHNAGEYPLPYLFKKAFQK